MIYVIFGKLITSIAFFISRFPIPIFFRTLVFTLFSRVVGITLDEVKKPLDSFSSLNAFFTRELRDDARPMTHDNNTLVSPVDGCILQFGNIHQGELIQAKGVSYSLDSFTGKYDVSKFHEGSFITVYLSPADCHRIFSPIEGKIIARHHIPGFLYPVREPHISGTKNLYIKNERLFTHISHPQMDVLLGKVGATNVGTMSLEYDNLHTNCFLQKESMKRLKTPVDISRGDHVATFHLGSTVVLITTKKLSFIPPILSHVKYGEAIGFFE